MSFDRRMFLSACTRAGIASPLLPGILLTLAAQAQEAAPDAKTATLPKITPEMLDRAAELAGVGPFTAEQKKMMLDGLNDQRDAYAQIRALKLTNDVPPAYVFHPGKAETTVSAKDCMETYCPPPKVYTCSNCDVTRVPDAPRHIEDLAFATIGKMSDLLQNRKITSMALSQMYIARLKRYDSKLHFVITLTEERAIAQAKKADEEIAAGKYRGPLHGIPWGVKDIIAYPGYPTTWCAPQFRHRVINVKAAVA